jgi:hypothetical protein
MLLNLPLALSLLVALQLCLSIAPHAAAASQQRSILLDDQGRLHIDADDVMILNASFRALLDQLHTLNTTLQQEIQTREQLIAELQRCTPTTTVEPATTGTKINPAAATQTAKLTASDGAADDYFGYAVAASDGMVVVGAYQDDDKGGQSGSAYVFEKNSTGQYEQVSKLVANDGAWGDNFGLAVAVADGMVLVGASSDDDKGSASGSVYVFGKNITGHYEQVGQLVASDGAADDRFGGSVAAIANMVVVGARFDNWFGSAYVFEKNSTGQLEQVSKLVASDGASGDNFGIAVAVADGMVLVGASSDDDKGSASGSVYVFEKNSTGQYEQVSKLVASDGSAFAYFGFAVAATKDTVVVGAHADDEKGSNSGSVYVFEKNSTGQYEQVSKLVASDGASNDWFGYAVAATDSLVIVGAYRDADSGSQSGSGYVFEKNTAGQFKQVNKLVASDGTGDAFFGYAVAVTDTMVVAGAYGDNGSGSVYVFE